MKRMFVTAGALLMAAGVLAAPGATAETEPTDAVRDAAPTAQIVEQRRLPDGTTETVVRTPIVVRPHSGHGGEHGHGTHTTIAAPMTPPCVNCYVTSVTPDLTYRDGSSANYDTGVMLHHAVLFDRSKKDVTCGDSRTFYDLTGRRIFASGNERTAGTLPKGYGVKLGRTPLTWGVVELMNMTNEPQTVFFDMTIRHVPASRSGMAEVTPVWLDAANCTGRSEHAAPAGESTTTWRWQSTISGTVKAVAGHLHDGGRSIALSNTSTGRHVCTSEAGYGTDSAYMGHLESMSVCTGNRLGTVRKGQVLQLNSVYDIHHAAGDVMSIMMAFVDLDG